MSAKRILVIGAGGRVGSHIVFELLRRGHHVALVDAIADVKLQQRAGRLLNDARLASQVLSGTVAVYGAVNALNVDLVAGLIAGESPDLVINYAIPITWDAAKRLPNYSAISAAGLGAFTPIQVLTPLKVAEAIAMSGVDARYMVGNLPDITIPIINSIAARRPLTPALCGAGNVGLNQVAMRHQAAVDLDLALEDVEVSLVSHHLHWVAPREPGYSNEGPFMAQVRAKGEDVSSRFPDLRELMNDGVRNHYESDASFSSTTGILAARVAMALLDDSATAYALHVPAPNGLPGGYPVKIVRGEIEIDLPQTWRLEDATAAMGQCNTLDGVDSIAADGSVRFTDLARSILSAHVHFELPERMRPDDIESVAEAQIQAMNRCFEGLD